jgi:hypothetical protein
MTSKKSACGGCHVGRCLDGYGEHGLGRGSPSQQLGAKRRLPLHLPQPNGDSDEDEDEQPLGDMWTFNCPSGGTVIASVDTKDDTDTGGADIDPFLVVVDGAGNLLVSADDSFACTYPPICGFACPAVEVECGTGLRHSLIVRDLDAGASGAFCQEGGGYELTVEVFRANGAQQSASAINLGGGPARTVPAFAREEGAAPRGPVLDDENVPREFDEEAAAALRTKSK